MRRCALDHRPHQASDAAGFCLCLDREVGLTAAVFEPVAHGEADRPRDPVEREQSLGLELRDLDLGASVATEETTLVLEVRADSHLSV